MISNNLLDNSREVNFIVLHNILANKPDIIADAPTDMIVVEVGSKDNLEHFMRNHGNKKPHKVPDKYAQMILPDIKAPRQGK